MQVKPRISFSAAEAYERVSKLANDTPIRIQDEDAIFLGMTGYLVTVGWKGRVLYFRVGAPSIETITEAVPA